MFDADVVGPHRVCRAVLPGMRAQGNGTIINITDLAANFGLPYRGFYSAAKAALERYTEALSTEYGFRHQRVQSSARRIQKTNIGADRIKPAVVKAALGKATSSSPWRWLSSSFALSHDLPMKWPCWWKRSWLRGGRKAFTMRHHGMQRVAVVMKKLLPGRWFEKLVLREYK